ncbi:protein kinase domain protein [Ichthyophthirius multifiliis]|uniref:cGMP-dependent protein kinase n=1 Tax=Ichthyophthirius multifiliis TaxID=5932 RepID=G0R544_ICHMU|nr:protein kinase domain protein [Ichthyophthirius multifiliis]EGR27446.1 protein kinase domain protein [Ichthyophthirius multifiliis]|eukprot:XP_004024356.1 protein kinase domain protein [Ichthyophthirius multifiliis]
MKQPISDNKIQSTLQEIHRQQQLNQEEIQQYQQQTQNYLQSKVNISLRELDEKSENFIKTTKKPTKDQINFISESFSNHSVFYILQQEQKEEIIQKMFNCECSKGEFLFRQNDNAYSFFILEKGNIQIEIDGIEKKQLGPGAGIGELALLYCTSRTASVKCLSYCEFWVIDKTTFIEIIEEIVHKDFQANRSFMESVAFFFFMSDDQKDAIASALISVMFKPGQFIANEGDRADSFYLIKEGKVSIWKDGKMIRYLYVGDSFGEQALYVKSTRAASIKAEDDVKLLSLGREHLKKILGGKVQKIVYLNRQRWAFSNNKLLQNLTNIQVEKISIQAKISNFKKGTILFEKGDYCDTLIAVLEGVIKEENSGNIQAEMGQIFGDYYLLQPNCNKQFEDRIIVEKEAVLSTISFKLFQKCIGGDIETVIKKNENSHELKMKKENQKEDYSYIKMEDLIHIKKLNEGEFGSVHLVQKKQSKNLYALKCISKKLISTLSLEKHVLQEKLVLEQIQFPFIISLVRTFKDQKNLYLLLTFINGQQMFEVIREIGLLSSCDAQFYIASLILSIEYLHQRQIIYRDIKPENLIVDKEGYMYLIDLGQSKILNKGKHRGRTFTIIGTANYMAPEIIKGKGYSFNADLWSIGVLLYEFMSGMVPFGNEKNDPYEIYQEILNKDVKYPDYFKDKKAKRLIDQLLSLQPQLRLGGSYASLKNHAWFDNLEWDLLYNKQLKPPFIPVDDCIIQQDEINKKYVKNKYFLQYINQEYIDESEKYTNLNLDLDNYF